MPTKSNKTIDVNNATMYLESLTRSIDTGLTIFTVLNGLANETAGRFGKDLRLGIAGLSTLTTALLL